MSPFRLGLLFFVQIGGAGSWIWYSLVLDRMGVGGAAVGAALAASSLARILAAPAWAAAADRWHLGPRLLLVTATLQAALMAAAALGPAHPGFVAAVTIVFSAARAPVGPLLDALAVGQLTAQGRPATDYGKVRLWGSVGFLAVAMVASLLVDHLPAVAQAPLWPGLAVWLVALALCVGLPQGRPAPPTPLGPAFRALGARPFFWPFALAITVYGVALCTYDSLFPLLVSARGLPAWVTGGGLAVGVAAEVAVMAGAGPLLRRVAPLPLVAVAMLVGAARWAAMAVVEGPAAIVALQALHGLSFGVFWVAGVELLRGAAPPELRASAQAFFTTAPYGVGAVLMGLLTGAALEPMGVGGVFGLSAALSIVAAGLVAWAAARERVATRPAAG
jgi:PPP family 3-phenylpropionic acid transporter